MSYDREKEIQYAIRKLSEDELSECDITTFEPIHAHLTNLAFKVSNFLGDLTEDSTSQPAYFIQTLELIYLTYMEDLKKENSSKEISWIIDMFIKRLMDKKQELIVSENQNNN